MKTREYNWIQVKKYRKRNKQDIEANDYLNELLSQGYSLDKAFLVASIAIKNGKESVDILLKKHKNLLQWKK
jgi:hypothetical protein